MFCATFLYSRMVAFAGKHPDLREMLRSLVDLGIEAAATYAAAVVRLEHAEFKEAFEAFRADHLRHERNLGWVLEELHAGHPDSNAPPSRLRVGESVIAT